MQPVSGGNPAPPAPTPERQCTWIIVASLAQQGAGASADEIPHSGGAPKGKREDLPPLRPEKPPHLGPRGYAGRAPGTESPPPSNAQSWSPASAIMRGYNPPRGGRKRHSTWTGAQPGPDEHKAPSPPNPDRFVTYDRDGQWKFLKLPGIWLPEFNEHGETRDQNRIRVDLAPNQFEEDFVGNDPPEWAIARSSRGQPYNIINKQWCCLHGKEVDYTAPSPFDHLQDERYENDEPFGLRGTIGGPRRLRDGRDRVRGLHHQHAI